MTRDTNRVVMRGMKAPSLSEYIKELGDERASNLFGVKERTIKSWRLRTRTPRPAQAKVIVERSPVTYEGIYS